MVQGDVTNEDIVFGSVALAIFLTVAVAAGMLLSRFRNQRFRNEWESIMPLLENAKITGDGAGAATSWLSGKFHGRLIHASMTPGVARTTGSALKGNRFSIIVPDAPGKHNWTAQYAVGFPLAGEGGWDLHCDDEATQSRLEQAGIVQRLQNHGVASVRFNARDHKLVWEALIEPYLTLPPEHFASTTETLLDVAEHSAAINA